MLGEKLVRYCAPTLAGLKTGNLFSCRFPDRETMVSAVRKYNAILRKRGVRIVPLRRREDTALLYVYRPELLKRDLSGKEARDLLSECGYPCAGCGECIREIIKRLRAQGGFPHEIGLFLSYPPEDVRGFIENRAAGCKACGHWKVYGDVEAARSAFARFRRCTELYLRSWSNGCPLERLAVAPRKEKLS